MKRESNQTSTNIWEHKPGWCQPWSIILTGLIIISGSWLLLHIIWLTVAIALAIVAWWIYFLILYPQAFAEESASEQ